MNPPEYLQIEEIIARASKDLKGDCYFVGGYVRDNLLGRVSKDIDLVVVGDTPDKLLLLIAKKFNWSPPTYAKRFGTAQVNGKIGKKTFFVEAVTARKESYSRDSRKPNVVPASLEEDLLRRDFTINTLCKDMEGNLLDLTKKGLTDLKAGIVRTPQEPIETFSDDPLRMLRAARFCSTLNFTLDESTKAGLISAAPRIKIISAERIREELVKILLSPKPSVGLRILQETKLMDFILPELSALAGLGQNKYHKFDAFNHTLEAVDLSEPPTLIVRLSALLHDIGKVSTRSVDDRGRVHFYDHEDAGMSLAKNVCERLRFSNDVIQTVTALVALHMRPMLYNSEISDKAVRRLIFEVGDLWGPLLSLSRADSGASALPDLKRFDELEFRKQKLDKQGVLSRKEPILRGELIMDTLGIPPGPLVGEVLHSLEEAVIEGDIELGNKSAALIWLESKKDTFQQSKPGTKFTGKPPIGKNL